MLDDEVQVRERGSRVIDIFDVKRIFVERPDRRALVDVNVVYAQFLALLQVALGLRVLKGLALRSIVPLCCVALDALDTISLILALELPQTLVAVSGVKAAVQDELVGVGTSPPNWRRAQSC